MRLFSAVAEQHLAIYSVRQCLNSFDLCALKICSQNNTLNIILCNHSSDNLFRFIVQECLLNLLDLRQIEGDIWQIFFYFYFL